MYGSPFTNSLHQKQQAPSQFKENARNAIYNQLPSISQNIQLQQQQQQPSSSLSIRSAPSQFLKNSYKSYQSSHRSSSSSSSIFSSLTSTGKRSVRSAPSIYSSSTGTIPEDSEQMTTTVEQLVNDIVLHEQHFSQEFNYKQQQQQQQQLNSLQNSNESSLLLNPSSSSSSITSINSSKQDPEEYYKISLGSNLSYQNDNENYLIDWNLNVTRCKLILTQLPLVSSTSDTISYNQTILPQLIGDLASKCNIIIIQPHLTDSELIFTLIQSNLYQEHNLDINFKKSVAEISVKQSRLLQINSRSPQDNNNSLLSSQSGFLKFKFKEIAIRNYLINLAAAATTAQEYKFKLDEFKQKNYVTSNNNGKKIKLSKDDKKLLWEQVRSDVFKRAGLE
ncbi:STD1 [Candida jiufengensis]|uniref:STD1 n=1 Tax=Candida jiufengensis TaxID=497108 RepID=UPI0022257995|nr:STD1 [Candida jiufengensis]KAI5952576.1 STD1 [Candida jiufengensis]